MARKVFVSGCFDLLHSGHAAFLKTAASLGDVYVGVGRDETIALLKGKLPANTETERLFMVKSMCYVKDAWLNSGTDLLDFAADIERLRPDIFVVNEDGHTPEKEALCARLGIDYLVLQRKPEPGLPARSTSALRSSRELPYRIEICGGWLDQPFINCLRPGYVICAQMEPHPAFARVRGGLASSTRACLAQLNAAGLAGMEPETLARLTFRYENGIDQTGHPVSGAQDAIGLCVPGVTFQYYDNGYWPRQVDSTRDAEVLRWLERHLSLFPIGPRPSGFDPLRGCSLQDAIAAETLAQAAQMCKSAIETCTLAGISESFSLCRQAQKALFPAMFPPEILSRMERLKAEGHIGNWKFTGCGGGGWSVLLNAQGLRDAVPLKIST